MKKIISQWLNLLLIAGVVLVLASSCSKSDENADNPIQGETVKDIDGNVYQTVTIGTQVWMVENLKTTKYRNGDDIPNVTEGTAWGKLTSGAQCSYDNNAAFSNKYGKLYNWYAVNDSRNIAPSGWHVATDTDWTTLENHVSNNFGHSGSIAKALAAKTDWASSNRYETEIGYDLTKNNFTGFTALPSGSRGSNNVNGTFGNISLYGEWWSSTEKQTNSAWSRYMGFDTFNIVRDPYGSDKGRGLSVRCVKNL